MIATIEQINEAGYAFVEFALPMLIQLGFLVLILLLVDLLLRKKVRAVFRYWMWMLVLVKLLLPTSLSSPVSLGRWFGDELAYVDMTSALAPEPKVGIAPEPAVKVPPVIDIRRVETITRAPAVVPVEPTIQRARPIVAKLVSPPAPPPTPLSWQGAALLSWLAVIVAMVLLLLQRALFVRRLIAQAGQASSPMADALGHCCQRMAVKRKVDLRISASATSPAVCGLSKPVILVPKNLTPSLSLDGLRVVLLHELAHIKRRDLWVNLAQTILQIFYFYNPLLWLANAMIRRVREQAVDEMVLVAMGDKARQYPETLVNVAKLAFKRPVLSLRLIGVVESKSALTGRIKHILNRPIPKTARLGIFSLLVVLVAAAILLPMAAFAPGAPELIIKGIVKDAQTGKPIAGARVFDDGYGPIPLWDQIRADEQSEWGAITNSAGEYSFLTWPEHHSISAKAPGYTSKRESLYDNHFTTDKNDEETMDFVLEPEAVKGPAKEGIGSDSPHLGLLSPSVPVIAYEVKLNFADPTVRDGSFHSEQSVAFLMSFHGIESLQTDILFGRLLIGQTTWPLLLKDDCITIQEGVSGQEIRSETWPADEREFEKVITLPLKYGQKEYSCPVHVELMRPEEGTPMGSYWFCAYLSGRLPWGAGGRGFEIVNLDQQMEFRLVGDGTDKRDALLGIDIDGDGKIDPAETGREQFDLYEPFQIGSKTYRVAEVDPYLPRVVFHEVQPEQPLNSVAKLDVQVEGGDPLFTVCGRVTDDSGRPVEGVQLTADCGHGKLERTGRAVTDQNGRYVLGLTSSIKNLGADPYDVGIQTARIEARAKGFYEANICREGNLTMAGKPPSPDEQQFVADYAGVVLPHKPYELNFVMRPAARIEGELVDEQGTPMPRLGLWLGGDGLYLSNRADIYGRSDRNGKFIIEDTPCKSIWFNYPGPKLVRSGTVDLAMPGTYRIKLQYVESALGEPTLKIAEFHGPASVSSEMSQSDLYGRIADAAGSPVAGAQVAFSTDKIGVQVSDGKLKPIRSDVESRIVQTDLQGAFALGQRPADSFILIVAHDRGFAFVRSEEFTDSHEIRLQPWGRIEGRVVTGRDAEGGKIWMSSLPNSTWFLHKREYRHETECDTDGRFVFEKVPAGWFEAGYWTKTGDSGWSPTSRTPVEVESGRTANFTLGGSGRPVIGRFVPPEGYDKPIYFGNGLRSLITTRPDEPRPENYDRMTRREQQEWRSQWRKSDQYRKYRDAYWHNPNWRQFAFMTNKDGSFRIEDVVAGEYEFTVWIEERMSGQGRPEEIATYSGTIEVPQMPGGRSDEPLDLGELELTMNDPLRVGDVAPLFAARTLDGEDVKLIDYRGKFVLLSFWQPVFHPELERLKILSAGYNAVGRLEIIGLGGQDTLEEIRKYVQENDIPWPQIFTGEEFKSGIAKDYRIPGMPWIFLIGPDGRILANGLRGEKLSSTVLEALETPSPSRTETSAETKAPQPPFFRDKVTDVRLPFTFTIYTLTPDNKPQPGVKVRCLHPRPERAGPIVDMVVESDENGVAEFTITQADLLTDWMYWFSLDDEEKDTRRTRKGSSRFGLPRVTF